jgi:hypothetical protein
VVVSNVILINISLVTNDAFIFSYISSLTYVYIVWWNTCSNLLTCFVFNYDWFSILLEKWRLDLLERPPWLIRKDMMQFITTVSVVILLHMDYMILGKLLNPLKCYIPASTWWRKQLYSSNSNISRIESDICDIQHLALPLKGIQ